jgi:hypothetical protein
VGALDGGVHLVTVADVGLGRRALAAQRGDLVGDLARLLQVQVDHGDVGTVGGQAERDRPPDSPVPHRS